MTSTYVGRRLRARRLLLAATTALATAGTSPAFAQYAPVRQSVDGNGVELFSGVFMAKGPAMSLGQGDQAMTYQQFNSGSGWSYNLAPSVINFGTSYVVYMSNSTERFTGSGSTFTSTEGNGSTISVGSPVVYTRRDGMKITFGGPNGMVSAMTMPNGTKFTYLYDSLSYCSAGKPLANGWSCTTHATARRLAQITSSNGYRLTPYYDNFDAGNFDPNDPSISPQAAGYFILTSVKGTNLAVAGGGSGPTQTFNPSTYPTYWITDPMGRKTTYRMNGGQILGITLPGETSESVTVGYTSGRVTSVATPAGTTTYASSDAGDERTVTVTDPLSHVTTYKYSIASQRMTSVKDANNHTTSMTYDAKGRLASTTYPELNHTDITYDDRGNVTQRKEVAKPGSGLADIVLDSGYDATCAYAVKCNKPNWTKDAKLKQTDYTYDTTHGGLLKVRMPDPDGSGTRPETRFGYTSMQANYDKGSGIVASGQDTYLLTSISQCSAGDNEAGHASCVGTANEIKTTIGYGVTTGVGNNLLPVSVSEGSGNGALTATTAMAYDDIGNTLTIDGPLAGPADTTRTRYNADREVIGVVAPDPDGVYPAPDNSLKHRAVRNTIDSKGLLTKTEIGTVTDQSDAKWALFAPAQVVDITYDNARRLTTKKLSSGGTAYALTQTGYNADDSVDCVATRMNKAAFGSLPASACTLGTAGNDGPDRITKTTYDSVGHVTSLVVAYGDSGTGGAQATERALTYTNNGKLASITDGENNKSTYVYDGFDRQSAVIYPSFVKGDGNSNGNDWESVTFDANSNVTSRRLRDANTINYGYDNLNRMIAVSSSVVADRGYSYDLLGRLSSAWFQTGGQGIVNSYDALGRLTSSVTNVGGTARTMSYQYDLRGARTRMTWWDNNYVDYDRLVTGQISKVRLNGAVSGAGILASFDYDDLGRRTKLTRGNASSTIWGYDAISRLSSLSHVRPNATNELVLGYEYNPASQIISATRSNDAYAWTGNVNVNRGYTSDGLNRYTAAGSVSFSYDGRGNLTADGTYGYGYDGENKLVSVAGAATASLSYDPLGRLDQYNPGSSRRFIYDGSEATAELDGSGAILRRYVRGGGADELLVDFIGSGFTDPRYVHSDERGTVIALSDSAGTTYSKNTFDEYGIPGSANTGRFQFTGQAWLGEIGLQYSKARMYSPTMGRFLQTDPVGYADGPNSYNYVGSDPLNRTDPTGLFAYTCTGSLTARCDSSTGTPMSTTPGTYSGGPWDGSPLTREGYTSPDSPQAPASIQHFQGQYINGEWHGSSEGVLSLSGLGNLRSSLTADFHQAGFGDSGGTEKVTPQDIRSAQQQVIQACRPNPSAAACATARQAYQSLNRLYAQQHPLPRATGPTDERSIPRRSWEDVGHPLLNGVSCAFGLATVESGVGWAFAIYGCLP